MADAPATSIYKNSTSRKECQYQKATMQTFYEAHGGHALLQADCHIRSIPVSTVKVSDRFFFLTPWHLLQKDSMRSFMSAHFLIMREFYYILDSLQIKFPGNFQFSWILCLLNRKPRLSLSTFVFGDLAVPGFYVP